MKDKCLVSVSSFGRENYCQAQLKLIRSAIDSGWDGDYLMRSVDGYCDEYMGVKIELGSWPVTKEYGVSWQHNDCKYQFKPFAIQEARERGYKKILWCDSTIRIVKNPTPLFDIAAGKGVVAFDNLGFPLKNWISDWAVEKLHITPQQLELMPQIMACCIIFDFNNPITDHIFRRWVDGSLNGSFQHEESVRPGYGASRHDQSYLSGILNKHSISFLPYGTLVYPPHDAGGEYGNDYYFINRGV